MDFMGNVDDWHAYLVFGCIDKVVPSSLALFYVAVSTDNGEISDTAMSGGADYEQLQCLDINIQFIPAIYILVYDLQSFTIKMLSFDLFDGAREYTYSELVPFAGQSTNIIMGGRILSDTKQYAFG